MIVKLDFRKAFNSVRRAKRGDRLPAQVKKYIPEYFGFVSQMYRQSSHLIFGPHLLESACGVQQGDPLGPLLFCLVIKGLTERIKSTLNVWYLDDGTIGGPISSVIADLFLLKQGIQEVEHS